jgi:hypothetical protein
VGLFCVWLVGILVIMYLQRYHPVTKYKDEYKERQAELEASQAVENYDDEKAPDGVSVPVPQALAIGQGVDGTATRQ